MIRTQPLWIALPAIYVFGILAQTVTWRWWYLPRVHRPDLDKEISSRRQNSYDDVFKRMKERGYHFLGGLENRESLKTGDNLGQFLDALRWELFGSSRGEIARQYLLQFHMYRISYGILPPLALMTLIMMGLLGARVAGVPVSGPFLQISIGLLLSALLFYAALVSAKHRRKRSWKYLINGMNTVLGPEK